MSSHVNVNFSVIPKVKVNIIVNINDCINWGRGSTVVKALSYKSEGRWCHWNFSLP